MDSPVLFPLSSLQIIPKHCMEKYTNEQRFTLVGKPVVNLLPLAVANFARIKLKVHCANARNRKL